MKTRCKFLLVSFVAIVFLALSHPHVLAAEGGYDLMVCSLENEVLSTEHFSNMDELWTGLPARAVSGKTLKIVLKEDWNLYEEKNLSLSECPIELDLNGHSIVRHTKNNGQVSKGGVLSLSGNAVFKISDSRPDSAGYDGIKGGVITGGASTSGGGAFTLKDNAKLTIAGGTVYRCTTNEHGGAVMLTGSSDKHPTFEMTGGRIYFCQTTGAWGKCHGGAVYADQGDVLLYDCIIDSCYSEDNGGAVYMNSGSLGIKNARFSANHCLDNGGAVFISGGSLRVFGSRFTTNEAKKDGGAIYVDADEGSRIRDCVFTRNLAYGAGGALYINDDKAYIMDTDIIANSASGYGGGVYVDSRYDIGVKGLVRIYNNSGKNDRDNLTLQDGYASRAYLTDGGLYEGSSIGLSSTGTNVKYAEEISLFQSAYFFSDLGELALSDTYEREAEMLASSFSAGRYLWLFAGVPVAVICGAFAYFVKARKEKEGKA